MEEYRYLLHGLFLRESLVCVYFGCSIISPRPLTSKTDSRFRRRRHRKHHNPRLGLDLLEFGLGSHVHLIQYSEARIGAELTK